MADKKAVRIEIEYDDGSTETAHGDAAAQIKAWYDSAELMNCIHGAVYRGPKFESKDPKASGM